MFLDSHPLLHQALYFLIFLVFQGSLIAYHTKTNLYLFKSIGIINQFSFKFTLKYTIEKLDVETSLQKVQYRGRYLDCQPYSNNEMTYSSYDIQSSNMAARQTQKQNRL